MTNEVKYHFHDSLNEAEKQAVKNLVGDALGSGEVKISKVAPITVSVKTDPLNHTFVATIQCGDERVRLNGTIPYWGV